MARAAADPFGGDSAGGIAPGRGGFMRNGADVPYVTDPSGATTKHPGLKADLLALCAERHIDWRSDLDIDPGKTPTVAQLHDLLGERPLRVPYGSPSNRGKLIENSTNLTKWGERRVVLGIGADRSLVDDCSRLVHLDVDSGEYKTLADSIIIRAKDAAEANLAADRGTHVHALTEDHDSERDWVQRAAAGEVVGIPLDVQRQAVDAWATFLADNGLEVLAVEASCVDDTWRLAGTLDRILRCTKALRFRRVTGEIVEIPAGTIVVGDVKTSKKRAGRDGYVGWWAAYSIQIASYAQSVPYDTKAETRGEWPWPIDQTHALILRPNVVEVLAGEAERVEWELLHVDLVAGREHGGRCVVEAKAWEQRKDIFSVAQLRDDTDHAHSKPVASVEPGSPRAAGDGGALTATGVAADREDAEGFASLAPTPAAPDVVPAPAPAPSLAGAGTTIASPEAVPALPSPETEHADTAGITPSAPVAPPAVEQQAAVAPEAAAAELSPLRQAQADRQRINAEADAKRRLHVTPEEGTVSDERSFLVLQHEYERLAPHQQAWIVELGKAAKAANVDFGSRATKTARRYEILRSLIATAKRDETDDDVRGLLALVIGDVALFANVPLGQAIGSLSATEAATFARLALGELAVNYADDGTHTLVAAA